MHLVWATDDFTMAGQAYTGFPIVLWESMESCVEANQFLRDYLMRGVIGSERSWPNTGRAMYDYFSFLEANELDWRDVRRGEEKTLLAAYRDYCLKDVEMARNTVRQRLHYICAFYEYALKQGWVSRLPFTREDRMVRRGNMGFLAHVDVSGNKKSVRDVIPRHHKSLPRFLSKEQVQALLAATENPHHKMMIRLALQTGLRREEVVTFPLEHVFNPDSQPGSGRNVMVKLVPHDGTGIKTKGSKARDIWISRRFMAELHRYAVQVRGERASLSAVAQKPLFLTQYGQPYASHGKQMEVFVRKAGERAGIKVHPHMLRHTYATHTLVALQRNRRAHTVEPLVFVQRQLGHTSISTTMVYLHLINELVDDAVLAYDDELNDWMEVS